MTAKMIFNVFWELFPDIGKRLFVYQSDSTDKNAIKLVFKSDDKHFKSGKFSMDGKTYKLELEKK